MKKKILLRTLIPLTTVGISLGTALPLASCSCSNNEDNGGIHIFHNNQQIIDFAAPIANSVLSGTDANKDWSTYDVDDPTMLAWFNEKVDVQIISLANIGIYAELSMERGVDFIGFPCMYEYNSELQIATCSFEIVFMNPHQFVSLYITKAAGIFHVYMLNNDVPIEIDSSITKVGTDSMIRTLKVGGTVSFPNFIWPNVKFPTADPT